ncbi:MAG: tetratricopeptide repeat protein [Roseobacter sp.]
MKHFAVLLLMAGAPAAASCPAAPEISDALTALIKEANAAENQDAGRDVSARMWQLWLQAPDETAQSVLDRGMRARSNYDSLGALEAFTQLTDYCPNYAEGYNQRAFVSFLQGDYDLALFDLDKALSLSGDHVGAQSGRALTLMNLGRVDEARQQLLEALDNNPWLSERFLLEKGAPLASESDDI